MCLDHTDSTRVQTGPVLAAPDEPVPKRSQDNSDVDRESVVHVCAGDGERGRERKPDCEVDCPYERDHIDGHSEAFPHAPTSVLDWSARFVAQTTGQAGMQDAADGDDVRGVQTQRGQGGKGAESSCGGRADVQQGKEHDDDNWEPQCVRGHVVFGVDLVHHILSVFYSSRSSGSRGILVVGHGRFLRSQAI